MVETVQVTPEEIKPEDPNYEAEMAKLGEQAVTGEPPVEEPQIAAKPDNVPEKFYNAESGEVDYDALAKSYTELEKLQSAPKPPKESEDAKDNKDTSEDAEDPAAQAAESAGLNLQDLQQEYVENGTISDESYAALEKAGIDKDTVDSHIAGQEALVEQSRQQAFELTGGEENYQEMINWAKDSLTDAEIDSFNKQIKTTNVGVRETVIRGLHARFTAENGNQSKLVEGTSKSTGPSQSQAGYASNAELMADMGKPEYEKDPAFRAKVQAKLAKSTL